MRRKEANLFWTVPLNLTSQVEYIRIRIKPFWRVKTRCDGSYGCFSNEPKGCGKDQYVIVSS